MDFIGTAMLFSINKQGLNEWHKINQNIRQIGILRAQLQYLSNALDDLVTLDFKRIFTHLFAAFQQALPQSLVNVVEVALIGRGQVYDQDVQELHTVLTCVEGILEDRQNTIKDQ